MWLLVISTIRSGLRGRSFYSVFVFGVLLVFGAFLAAEFSPRQPETVAIDVGFSSIRIGLVFLGVLWIQSLIGNEIERRTSVLFLVYPIQRSDYLLGRFLGIVVLLGFAAIVFALLLWIEVMASAETYAQSHRGSLGAPFWLSIFAVWLNACTVAAFSLCIATLTTMPALPLILGLAFAMAGQSLGPVLQYLSSAAAMSQSLVSQSSSIIDVARWILPDLSRLDWRTWPMYDLPLPNGQIPLSIGMACSYILFMLLIASIAFKEREFD